MSLTCFLPCRAGSQRVPRKNVRPFGDFPGGLLEIKLRQLARVEGIDRVLLSTDDEEVIEIARQWDFPGLEIDRRDPRLASSATSTDELIVYAGSMVPEGHLLWTHVTSPFLSADLYSEIIRGYHDCLKEGYDSLMTVNELKAFLWNEEGPVNYDRRVEKWPRTQTLEPLYHINSGVFLAPAAIYHQEGDRIGRKPKLWPISEKEAFDIDWMENFEMGSLMQKQALADTGLRERE